MTKQNTLTHSCRLCRRCNERLQHLPSCKSLLPLRKLVRRFLKAMRVDLTSLSKNPKLLFGFGLDKDKKVIKCKVTLSLLRLFWRVMYRHLTRTSEEPLSTWYVDNHIAKDMCKDLARTFMAKILTYQLIRRDFFRKRRFSKYQEKLPQKAATEIAPIGKLNTNRGKLTLRPKLISIFKEYKCWNDFNLQSSKY